MDTDSQEESGVRAYEIWTSVFLILGVVLRFNLFWFNPPENAFDDHFTPIFLTIQQGAIPSKDACWECNQPPAFYVMSAVVGKVALFTGTEEAALKKALQFLPCLFGVMTLWLIFLILKQCPMTDFGRVVAFGVVCLLPRHIYMSALHSNDTLAYLCVALCIYLLFNTLRSNFSTRSLVWLALALSLTIFTKYTALIVLPAAVTFFTLALFWKLIANKRALARVIGIVFLLPLSLLGAYILNNLVHYGSALPEGIALRNATFTQQFRPGSSGINYWSFKPIAALDPPLLSPDNLSSFWTVSFGEMWFDMEPKFLYFVERNPSWWNDYYDYLKGLSSRFPDVHLLSASTLFTGSALIAMGFVPAALMGVGCVRSLVGSKSFWRIKHGEGFVKTMTLSVLLLCNAVGIILFSIKYPIFPHMKASFFLTSLPAFTVFLGLGLEHVEPSRYVRFIVLALLAALFLLVTLHIGNILMALGSG